MLQVWPFHRCARVSEVPRLLLVLPTAMHAERDRQDAAFRLPPAAPGGLGVGWMLQVLPFHRSASVSGDGWLTTFWWLGVKRPTAMHAVAEVQANPVNPDGLPPPPGSLGVGWMAQLVPSHRSARAWNPPEESWLNPAAVQADAEAQATVVRRVACAPAGLGVGWMLQLEPFQCWAKVPELEVPTAVHAEADGHDTAFRKLNCAPAGLGVAWIVHRVPFHSSAKVTSVPELFP